MANKQAVLKELGLESNKSPAKRNEKVEPTAFLPDAPPPDWKVPLIEAKEVVSLKSVKAAERAKVRRITLRPIRDKTYEPQKLAQFPNLGRFDVSDPDVERFREMLVTLAGLKKLQWLGLYGVVDTPAEIGALRGLRELTLRRQANTPDQVVTTVAAELSELRALESLTVWGGPLSKLPEGLETLENLRDCRLLDLQLKKLPEAFGRMPKLEALSMRLDVLDAGAAVRTLSKSQSLRSLALSCERLGEVESFGGLGGLVSLSLSSGLDEVPVSVTTLGALRFLALDFNRLKTIPDALGAAPALETLSVHGNRELDVEQVVDVVLRSKTVRGVCLPNAGPSPAAEKKLRAAGFRRARSMTGDQWFKGELLPSWRSMRP